MNTPMVGRQNFTEVEPLQFRAEARALGITAGAEPGMVAVPAGVGNGQPFVLRWLDGNVAKYLQRNGTATLEVAVGMAGPFTRVMM